VVSKVEGFKVFTGVAMNIQVFPYVYITAVDWWVIADHEKQYLVVRLSAFQKFGHFL